MNTPNQAREQALLLQVYYDDDKIVRVASRKILLLVRDLSSSRQDRGAGAKLLTAAGDLTLSAELIAIARRLVHESEMQSHVQGPSWERFSLKANSHRAPITPHQLIVS